MNNNEKVKNAIQRMIDAEVAMVTQERALEVTKAKLEEAASVLTAAKSEVSRQIHNICPNKVVIYNGLSYRNGAGGLEVDRWDGVMLDG